MWVLARAFSLLSAALSAAVPAYYFLAFYLLVSNKGCQKCDRPKDDRWVVMWWSGSVLLLQVDGVCDVHELHVWQLAGNRIIASAHIRCRSLDDYARISDEIKSFFHHEGIHSTTIQPEFLEVRPILLGIFSCIKLILHNWNQKLEGTRKFSKADKPAR